MLRVTVEGIFFLVICTRCALYETIGSFQGTSHYAIIVSFLTITQGFLRIPLLQTNFEK